MMWKGIIPFLILPVVAGADVLPLDTALRATYTACVGIDQELTELKKMAGITTAVTGVGTGLGAGALAAGIAKAKIDAGLKQKFNKMVDTANVYQGEDPTEQEKQSFLASFKADLQKNSSSLAPNKTRAESDDSQDLIAKSKSLGNWRTGLLAGNTATNIAGAVLAGKNKVDKDLQNQINICKASVKNLRDSIVQARMDGLDVTEADEIATVCGEYDYVDVSKINKRGTGALVSSVVGATTGVAGTVTSAVANSSGVRQDDVYANKDWERERKINTAANVLSGASAAASATATVFNATQISAIKKVAAVAEKCTGVLQ